MSAVKLMQGILESVIKGGGFDRHLSRVQIIAGGNGCLTATLKLSNEDSNRGGFLHGAMSTLLVDSLSTAALMTHPNHKSPGVSISLNMAFMKAVKTGEEILIKVSTDKVGGRMAFLTVDILDRKTGEMVAKGTHTKFMG